MEKYFNKNFYNISSVKDEISKLLSKTNSSVYYMFKLENLRGIWNDIVGEKLCNLTYPEYIYKKIESTNIFDSIHVSEFSDIAFSNVTAPKPNLSNVSFSK